MPALRGVTKLVLFSIIYSSKSNHQTWTQLPAAQGHMSGTTQPPFEFLPRIAQDCHWIYCLFYPIPDNKSLVSFNRTFSKKGLTMSNSFSVLFICIYVSYHLGVSSSMTWEYFFVRTWEPFLWKVVIRKDKISVSWSLLRDRTFLIYHSRSTLHPAVSSKRMIFLDTITWLSWPLLPD